MSSLAEACATGGAMNGGLVICPFLLKEKYQKFKADIMGLLCNCKEIDKDMSKTYPETKNESTMAAEPVVAYAAQNTSCVPMEVPTYKEDILATTMLVDAYFDELIGFYPQR